MKKFVLVFFILIAPVICPLSALEMHTLYSGLQVSKPSDGIKAMFEKKQYQEIIEKFAGKPRTLSAEELSYVSLSYIQLDDMENASVYADLAIKKDTKEASAYYAKGIISNAENKHAQALDYLQKAAALSPKQADFYTEIGDTYFAQDNFLKALDNYHIAIKQIKPSEKAFYMIAATYANMDNEKNALDTFYVTKSKIVKDRELLATTIYNIAKMEYDKKDYRKASEAYLELTDFFPDDYYSIEKLIQCYNALGYFSRAEAMKHRLYTAKEKGLLYSTSIYDMFGIDHFTVGSKDVSGYERYEKPDGKPFVKYTFYVVDDTGRIESTIFVEYSPAQNPEQPGNYYPILHKDSKRYKYNFSFDENVSYSTIQPRIMDIVSGKSEGILTVE